MKLEILSFNGKLFKSREVISVTAMTTSWEITVLQNHIPLITTLKPSVLKVVYKDDNNMDRVENFAIGWWVLEVAHSSMKILIDILVTVWEINVDLAQQAKERALAAMEQYKTSKDKVDMEKFIEAQDMLLKSVAQLKLHEIR